MDILSGKAKNKGGYLTYSDLALKWENFVQMGTYDKDQIEADRHFHLNIGNFVSQKGAGFFKQVYLCHNLSLLQQLRDLKGLFLEVFVGFFAGILMGSAVSSVVELYSGMLKQPFAPVSVSPVIWPVPQLSLLIGLAVALAGAPGGVRVFGDEMLVFWRNVESGHSPTAYYIGKTFSSFYRIILAGLHFSAIFVYLATPVISFWVLFGIITLFYFGVFGLSAFVSMIVKRQHSVLLAVVISMFSAVFCGYGPTLQDARRWNICKGYY
jgi:hypothetical protein